MKSFTTIAALFIGVVFFLPSQVRAIVLDYAVYDVPALARPSLRAPIVDPVFGSTIMRVTDPAMAPGSADGLRHEYTRLPALNANNTKEIAQVIGGTDRGSYYIITLANGQNLCGAIDPGSQDPEFSWHPNDPNLLFYRYSNEIRTYHADTCKPETIMKFNGSNGLPNYYAVYTKEEGRPSDDWRYYAFFGVKDSSFSSVDYVVADLVNKAIVSKKALTGDADWIGMSPLGDYVVIQWSDGQGTILYDRNLQYMRTLFSDTSHSDFAIDENGDEVLAYDANSAAAVEELGNPNGYNLARVRLRDGNRRIILGDGAGTLLPWEKYSTHVSGIASRAHHGWVLISTYADPSTPQDIFSRELFWLKLDGSGSVIRVAHHHSDQSFDSNGKDYWAEPQAVASWDGNAVLFTSVWGTPFSHYDDYLASGSWWARSAPLTNVTFKPVLEGRALVAAGRSFTLSVFAPATRTQIVSFSALVDNSGNVALPSWVSLPVGSYDILIYSAGYLKKRQVNVAFASNATIPLLQLTVGDLNSDNAINALDWSAMNSNWFSHNTTADINGDGVVNSLDFSYLNSNWNKQGD